jgi:hypothetical protein
MSAAQSTIVNTTEKSKKSSKNTGVSSISSSKPLKGKEKDDTEEYIEEDIEEEQPVDEDDANE